MRQTFRLPRCHVAEEPVVLLSVVPEDFGPDVHALIPSMQGK